MVKIYAVVSDDYGDIGIDEIFTSRELAEAWMAARQRAIYERDHIRAHRPVKEWSFGAAIRASGGREYSFNYLTNIGTVDGRPVELEPIYGDEVPEETPEAFEMRMGYRAYRDIEEYEVRDALPDVGLV